MKLKPAIALATFLSLGTLSSGAVFAQAGDPARGQSLYAACAACHGQNGEGNQGFNAPALTGLQDWYIIRQMQNFKSGARGSNPQDIYGQQMAPMAQILPDEQAIRDVTAYIMTLGE